MLSLRSKNHSRRMRIRMLIRNLRRLLRPQRLNLRMWKSLRKSNFKRKKRMSKMTQVQRIMKLLSSRRRKKLRTFWSSLSKISHKSRSWSISKMNSLERKRKMRNLKSLEGWELALLLWSPKNPLSNKPNSRKKKRKSSLQNGRP